MRKAVRIMGGMLNTSSYTIKLSTDQILIGMNEPTLSLSSPTLLDSGGVKGFSSADLSEIKGATLELRPLTPADFDVYKAAIERNADRLAPATGSRDLMSAIVQSQESFEVMWQLAEQARMLGTDFSFGVFEGDELIGEVALNAVRRGAHESGFLSAWIDKEHTGQNKVEEAFVLLCEFGFDTLGLNRIECAVLPENEAVQHALKKVGVESEGLARDYLMSDGEFKDHLRYVITASDWKARGESLKQEWVRG